jgi:hypothetical protein
LRSWPTISFTPKFTSHRGWGYTVVYSGIGRSPYPIPLSASSSWVHQLEEAEGSNRYMGVSWV